jgi:hypothetical protein
MARYLFFLLVVLFCGVIIPSTEGPGIFASPPAEAEIEPGYGEHEENEDYCCYNLI